MDRTWGVPSKWPSTNLPSTSHVWTPEAIPHFHSAHQRTIIGLVCYIISTIYHNIFPPILALSLCYHYIPVKARCSSPKHGGLLTLNWKNPGAYSVVVDPFQNPEPKKISALGKVCDGTVRGQKKLSREIIHISFFQREESRNPYPLMFDPLTSQTKSGFVLDLLVLECVAMVLRTTTSYNPTLVSMRDSNGWWFSPPFCGKPYLLLYHRGVSFKLSWFVSKCDNVGIAIINHPPNHHKWVV